MLTTFMASKPSEPAKSISLRTFLPDEREQRVFSSVPKHKLVLTRTRKHVFLVNDKAAGMRQVSTPLENCESSTRAHALAQREHFNLDIGKITTLSKNWARSSCKLNYEHASCLTEAQAIAPSLAPNHSLAQGEKLFRDSPFTILHLDGNLSNHGQHPRTGICAQV